MMTMAVSWTRAPLVTRRTDSRAVLSLHTRICSMTDDSKHTESDDCLRRQLDEIAATARVLMKRARIRINLMCAIVYMIGLGLFMVNLPFFHSMWFVVFVSYLVMVPPNPHHDVVARLRSIEQDCSVAAAYCTTEQCVRKIAYIRRQMDLCCQSVWVW